jgi:hypothetical protein
MKAGIFMLTKNEQRVVILVIMALLAGGFVRYWRAVNAEKPPNQSDLSHATATPFASPDEEGQPDQD